VTARSTKGSEVRLRRGLQTVAVPVFQFGVFSETDLTDDLKRFDVPTLIMHGDDDQIVPIAASAIQAARIVKGATLEIYKGAPHGMPSTLKDRVNADLLAFIKS